MAKLNLKLKIGPPGLSTALTLQRSVIVTVQAHRPPAVATSHYRIQWAPETPGPFPLFAGDLIVSESGGGDACLLLLSGNYEPPLGEFGQSFDTVIGNRLAQATASDLLEHIKGFIEKDSLNDAASEGAG